MNGRRDVRHVFFRTLLVGLAALTLLACSSSAPDASEPTPAPRPSSNVTVSDEVPTMQELRDTGLSDQQAECFITTIDPDGTGRLQNAELFAEAMSNCF